MLRSVLAAVAIFAVWSLFDAVAHRLVFEPFYASNANLWRPPGELNTPLVLTVTLVLVVVFVATYKALVRPRSFIAALCMGGLLGVALGASAGFGTYIHSPIPLALAWGWFILGTIKGVAAGVLLGALLSGEGDAR